MNMKPELLAPAGDAESGYAALHYGADAVYLGLGHFSARAEATNFTPEQFISLTSHAHSLNRRVLVAVNTVVFDEEIPALLDSLNLIRDAKADGVIVQDLGVARLIRTYFPDLRLHASTQLAVHNRAGVEALQELGFRRVVLARELTLEEIRDIRAHAGIELEVFVHGALCYCYSGLCLFSATYTGRSANRGKCVYPCREAFAMDGRKKHIFSMKDLAQEAGISDLTDAGVAALKIEGRKKSPLYVAAVTDYYRALLDGEKDPAILREKRDVLRCIFSRPTTALYLKDRHNRSVVDPDIVGHRGLFLGRIERVVTADAEQRAIRFRTSAPVARYDGIQIDLPDTERPFGFSAEKIRVRNRETFRADAGDTLEIALPDKAPYIPENAAVYLSSASAVKSAYPYPKPKDNPFGKPAAVRISVAVTPDKVQAGGNGASAEIRGSFTPEKTPGMTAKSILTAFEKTAENGLALEKIDIANPEGLFVPLSSVNGLRRDLYGQIRASLDAGKRHAAEIRTKTVLEKEKAPAPDTGCPVVYLLKTDDRRLLDALTDRDADRLSEIILELTPQTKEELLPAALREKIRWALPTIVRGWEYPALKRRIDTLLNDGWRRFEIGNVWGLEALRDTGADIAFDWPLYVANVPAARAALELGATSFTVSPETPRPDVLFHAFPGQATAMVYQDMPLFVSETCPRAAVAGECLKCGGTYRKTVSSRYGRFELVARDCRHWLLNERPHIRKDEAVKAGAKRRRLDFMHRDISADSFLGILRRLTED
ncbi:MAG: U32 family peptidase [Alphaproteobacteria bacterium]|mgnify:CR=1 FL=1|jgi:putative protease